MSMCWYHSNKNGVYFFKKKKIWRRIYLIRSYKETKEKWKDSLNIKIHCKICYCKQNGKRWFEWSFFFIKAEVKEKNSSEVCRKVIKCVKSIKKLERSDQWLGLYSLYVLYLFFDLPVLESWPVWNELYQRRPALLHGGPTILLYCLQLVNWWFFNWNIKRFNRLSSTSSILMKTHTQTNLTF